MTEHLTKLPAAGVTTILRCFYHRNSKSLLEKRLERVEAAAIFAAGMFIGVVFQQRGGAGGNISDLASITDYFATVAEQINGQYRVGVYGSGTVSKSVVSAGHAELILLPTANGWSGVPRTC